MVYDKSGATSGQISPCEIHHAFPRVYAINALQKVVYGILWYISVFLGINGDCYLNDIAIGVII